MNWPQLHTAATLQEREEITSLLLHRLHARRSRRIFWRGRLIQERRSPARFHFVDDRRRPWALRRGLLAFHATLASGLIFPALLLLAR
jgi:hypothetical protein